MSQWIWDVPDETPLSLKGLNRYCSAACSLISVRIYAQLSRGFGILIFFPGMAAKGTVKKYRLFFKSIKTDSYFYGQVLTGLTLNERWLRLAGIGDNSSTELSTGIVEKPRAQ